MKTETMPVGSLSGAEVFKVLKASKTASLDSRRLWHFRCTATAIELHAGRTLRAPTNATAVSGWPTAPLC